MAWGRRGGVKVAKDVGKGRTGLWNGSLVVSVI
jgi:hypothetical protein